MASSSGMQTVIGLLDRLALTLEHAGSNAHPSTECPGLALTVAAQALAGRPSGVAAAKLAAWLAEHAGERRALLVPSQPSSWEASASWHEKQTPEQAEQTLAWIARLLRCRATRPWPPAHPEPDAAYERLSAIVAPNRHWSSRPADPEGLLPLMWIEAWNEAAWRDDRLPLADLPNSPWLSARDNKDRDGAFWLQLSRRRGGDDLKAPLWAWHHAERALGRHTELLWDANTPYGFSTGEEGLALAFCGTLDPSRVLPLIVRHEAHRATFLRQAWGDPGHNPPIVAMGSAYIRNDLLVLTPIGLADLAHLGRILSAIRTAEVQETLRAASARMDMPAGLADLMDRFRS